MEYRERLHAVGGIGRASLRAARRVARRVRAAGSHGATVPLVVRRIREHHPSLTTSQISSRLAYSTYVNFERRYMYFEVPKAGCTSIKTFLHRLERLPPIEQGRFDRPVRPEALVHLRPRFGMPTLLDFSDDQQQVILDSPDFFRFTVVRNPYSRLISAWKDKILACAPEFIFVYEALRGRPPRNADDIIQFDEFIEFIARENLDICDPHWRRQSAHLFYPALDFRVGRLENLGQTIEALRVHLNLDEIESPPHSHEVFGAAGYSPESSASVFQLYKPDFEIFGFDRNGWQKNAAGGKPAIPMDRFLEEVITRNVIIARFERIRQELMQGIKDPRIRRHLQSI